MPRRVIATPVAAEGFRAARKWLLQPGSGVGGRGRWNHLRAVKRQLRDWPYIGPESPEHPGGRYFVCEGHFIVYRVDPDTGDSATAGDVIILTVFGPGQKRHDDFPM